MSEAELFFKYKAEKAFESKVKILIVEMIHDFEVKLSTAMNQYTQSFQKDFDKEKLIEFALAQKNGLANVQKMEDYPRTLETLNKTWEDMMVLTAKVNEIKQNITQLHRHNLEDYFFNDIEELGHERFS